MKLNRLAFFGAMIATSMLAQQITNAPPASSLTPAAASTNTVAPAGPANTNAPATETAPAKSGKKKSAKKPAAVAKRNPAAELKTVPLVPGPAVVDANHVNVRGQPKLKSEILTRLDKGQPVTVIEEITRNNSAVDEPSAWAKIFLPTNAHAWVNSSFIEPANKTVIPRKLNLRSGPGENYSVIGQLLRGDLVTELGAKGAWTEIQPPTNAYAFVAAQFLKQEPAGGTPTAPTELAAQTPAESSTVTQPPAMAAAPTEPPATPPSTAPSEAAPATNTPPELAATNAPAVSPADLPPPKRIVEREGIVRGAVSIQSPTHFGLYNLQNGMLIDYIYTSSPNLDLRRYKGLHIIVTGEEGLDERWGNTPVITIQKIQVVED
jgi:uncharacterized protein YgiM (DUF1202 family)